MSLGELLETCRSRRIELWSEAGRLRYRAPQGALDAGLAERLRAEREALLEHLEGGPGWRAEPDLVRESEINQKGKARKLWDIEEGKGI